MKAEIHGSRYAALFLTSLSFFFFFLLKLSLCCLNVDMEQLEGGFAGPRTLPRKTIPPLLG